MLKFECVESSDEEVGLNSNVQFSSHLLSHGLTLLQQKDQNKLI